jgi:putative sterol carrier protein
VPETGQATADPTARFFEQLESSRHHPALEKSSGTLRFELTDDGKRVGRWLVEIDKGDVAVSRKNAKADCVVRAEKTLFDGMVSGRVNPIAAFLRAELAAEGDISLMASFVRIFPGPPKDA